MEEHNNFFYTVENDVSSFFKVTTQIITVMQEPSESETSKVQDQCPLKPGTDHWCCFLPHQHSA